MFESLKTAIDDLVHGRVAPGDRREMIAEMKRALVRAKLGAQDLREGVEQTRLKLAAEKEQLATVLRRKALAEGISDAETVALAATYEQKHGDRVAVLERKLEAQEAETILAERDLADMMTQLKSASAGVGTGTPSPGPSHEELGLGNDDGLHSELDGLARRRARGDADAAADAKLAELKKRMGRP